MGPKRKAATDAAERDPRDGMVLLHRSSFIDWQPTPIVALASSRDGSLSAAVRENGDLELYETSTSHLIHRIAGHVDAAPTSIAVVDQDDDAPLRLFTAGLDGNIVEYDVDRARPAAVVDSYGGAVWQLAVEPAPPIGEPRPSDTINSEDEEDDDESENPRRNTTSHGPSFTPRLAAACDDGCVRLFTVEPGVSGPAYAKSLPKVEGRTLAVTWHPSGQHLVSGGTDACIHAWEVATGRETLRITAGDASGSTDLCIWSLLVLPDGTIVSGDSNGNVSFWHGTFGTLLSRFTQHTADVLQLAATPDGLTVFAAGVDPRIAVFRRLEGSAETTKGTTEWVFLSAKRSHSHDVRAMCIAPGLGMNAATLLTAGNDTILLAHSADRFLKEHPRSVNSCPQRPIILAVPSCDRAEVASKGPTASNRPPLEHAALLMVADRNTVNLWQLVRHNLSANMFSAGAEEGGRIPAPGPPIHLAQLTNRTGNHIISAAAMLCKENGKSEKETFDALMAFSDAHRMLCFRLTIDRPLDASSVKDAPPLRVVKVTPVRLPADVPPAAQLFFRPGSASVLVAVSLDGIVRLIDLEGGKSSNEEKPRDAEKDKNEQATATMVHSNRELHDLRFKIWYKRDRSKSEARRLLPAVQLAALSPDGRWLAAEVRGRVFILGLDSHRGASAVPPLTDQANVTLSTLGFTPDSSTLVVVSVSNHIAAFTVPSGEPTEWTRVHPPKTVPERLQSLPGPVVGIAANPCSLTAVLLYSSEAVCHLDFTASLPTKAAEGGVVGKEGKRRRTRETAAESRISTPAGQNCRMLYCQDPLLHIEAIGKNELVVIERPWADVLRGLAPPLYRHRYGT